MFYPVDSLKKGGRFYLCWVADSWPLRFATLTHRQLWSQDIRKICDDLIELVANESGRPSNRFSLRLSSQLMRGLVRLYQRKVSIFLGELCMLNASVIKHANKKWSNFDEVLPSKKARVHIVADSRITLINDINENVELMIQASDNVVPNLQDITLKENTIVDQIIVNDGFGEEITEQILTERTLEQMLGKEDASAVQFSGLDLPMDTSDKSRDISHDKSRDRSKLGIEAGHMERISEHDISLFKKSVGEGIYTSDFEKDIPTIPDILVPDSVPTETNVQKANETSVAESNRLMTKDQNGTVELVDLVLEELEEVPSKKRKSRGRLIIDKNIKLSSNFLRARTANHKVELRCEDSTDDIIDIRVSPAIYFNRPAHGGHRFNLNVGYYIRRYFLRNLEVIKKDPLADREMEKARRQSRDKRQISVLEKIVEEDEPAIVQNMNEKTLMHDLIMDVPTESNANETYRISHLEQMDISDLPTQILVTHSQQKRKTPYYLELSLKRQRLSGYVSFKERYQAFMESEVEAENIRTEKENIIPVNPNIIPIIIEPMATKEFSNYKKNLRSQSYKTSKDLNSMLQQAGLADIPTDVSTDVGKPDFNPDPMNRNESQLSETPLGSLDKTRVSLGESEKTTDSKRFIRDHWGTEGTMMKIISAVKREVKPLNVDNLLKLGPVIQGHKKAIAARCFVSILKLKQHGFIMVSKNSITYEVEDILLGSKFNQST